MTEDVNQPALRPLRVLPESVVNKIAAGEVIERPASLLKELVENAIDAGSSSIVVRLDGVTGRGVKVIDDGRGMSGDDLLLALERHSTSKISCLDDIETVSTLGFRGEALPSIASVSRLTIESCRPGDQVGSMVQVVGGRLTAHGPVARTPGTTVTVHDLFFNTPVRRKFLRSAATERSHLLRTFLRLAMSRPDIRMEAHLDGDAVHVLPASGNLDDRIRSIFGGRVVGGMSRVDAAEPGGLSLAGYVVDPSRPLVGVGQFFFVNGRSVDDRFITACVREGIASAVSASRRADFILFLSVDPRQMDVNVHPAKREVRFSQPTRLATFIRGAVGQAITGRPSLPVAAWTGTVATPTMPAVAGGRRLPTLIAAGEAQPLLTPPATTGAEPLSRATAFPAPPSIDDGTPRYLGQFLSSYLAFDAPDGLLLLDQHAAHERILYERVMDRLNAGGGVSQPLVIPEEIAVSPLEEERLAAILPLLEGAGCQIEPFGRGVMRLTSLPPDVTAGAVASFVADLLAHADRFDGVVDGRLPWREELAALTACHDAIRAGDRLPAASPPELLRQLLACRDPRHCPHGRPTMITLARAEVERLFGRT
jgi:DNA mismatch repair protein MutL